jgi:hypothetical protein
MRLVDVSLPSLEALYTQQPSSFKELYIELLYQPL